MHDTRMNETDLEIHRLILAYCNSGMTIEQAISEIRQVLAKEKKGNESNR